MFHYICMLLLPAMVKSVTIKMHMHSQEHSFTDSTTSNGLIVILFFINETLPQSVLRISDILPASKLNCRVLGLSSVHSLPKTSGPTLIGCNNTAHAKDRQTLCILIKGKTGKIWHTFCPQWSKVSFKCWAIHLQQWCVNKITGEVEPEGKAILQPVLG